MMETNSENEDSYVLRERMENTECYVCKGNSSKRNEPLTHSCGCSQNWRPIHYSCITDLIVNDFDPPCDSCGFQFVDRRITRHPTFNSFMTRGPGIIFTIIFFVINMQFMSGRILSIDKDHTQENVGRIYSSRLALAVLFGLTNSLLIHLALVCYKVWYKSQPKVVVLESNIDGVSFTQHLDLTIHLVSQSFAKQRPKSAVVSSRPVRRVSSMNDIYGPVVRRFPGGQQSGSVSS